MSAMQWTIAVVCGVATSDIIFTIEFALTADTSTVLSTTTGNSLTATVDA